MPITATPAAVPIITALPAVPVELLLLRQETTRTDDRLDKSSNQTYPAMLPPAAHYQQWQKSPDH